MNTTEIIAIPIALFVTVLAFFIAYTGVTIKNQQKTIASHQDTIQRLINREPVTYTEVGQKPTRPVQERYAAWGSQMVNIEEEEHS